MQKKYVFIISLTYILLFTGCIYLFFDNFDKGVTIDYMGDGYADTKEDLVTICGIVNHTDLTKNNVITYLKDSTNQDTYEKPTNTISINRVDLVFDQNSLSQINMRW